MSTSRFDFDLLSIPLIKKVMKSRWFQPILLWISLTFFVVFIIAGLFGSPIGSRNSAIVIIWILWFFLLVAFMLPIGGRLWCMMCPLPAPAEWISRRAFVRKTSKVLNLGKKWPSRLDNIWLQNFGFLGIAAFSPVIFYYPMATAITLLSFVAAAVVLCIIFTNRARVGRIFCRYVCPLGGFVGLYSLTGAIEVKHRDPSICKTCKYKTCMKGNEKGWGCPWFLYPGGLERNAYCGLCTECIKGCYYDNMTFKTRIFGQDLLKEGHMDEAFKSFIMIGSVFVYTIAYFGWWDFWKDVSRVIQGVLLTDLFRWDRLGIFATFLWGTTLAVVPGIHLGFAWLSKKAADAKEVSLKKLFVDYAYALVPISLAGWIAFMVYLVMIQGSLIIAIISDPLGWGWDLFGTGSYPWKPFFTGWIPYIAMLLFLAGGVLTTRLGWKISLRNFGTKEKALRAMVPMTIFFIGITWAFLYLYVMP